MHGRPYIGFEKGKSCELLFEIILLALHQYGIQVGHVPFTAGRPFFNVVSLGSLTSLFALHFTQYA
jgi:hypothetical protein